MNKTRNYDVVSASYKKKAKSIASEFPEWCSHYYRELESLRAAKTLYVYMCDLKNFFSYLKQVNPVFDKPMKEITLDEIAQITKVDIEEYREYVSQNDSGLNGASIIRRKIASLRSFYAYYVKNRYLEYSPAAAVSLPTVKRKQLVYLDEGEITELFNYMNDLECVLSIKNPHRLPYFLKTKYRDTAMMMLLVGTGIRVSECTGLNLNDVNFKDQSLIVVRKGGNEDKVYFNGEVAQALEDYLELERPQLAKHGNDDLPLFYSMQGNRISNRAVENMVKKYAREVVPLKNITVHKLRTTFATNVIRKTGDAFTVSKALGHSSMAMVKVYSEPAENQKRMAAESVSFRNDPDKLK